MLETACDERKVTLLKVRSGVAAGGSGADGRLQNCQENLAYWQKDYAKWYQEAQRKGYV